MSGTAKGDREQHDKESDAIIHRAIAQHFYREHNGRKQYQRQGDYAMKAAQF